MVIIEKTEPELYQAVWADGYLPDLATLQFQFCLYGPETNPKYPGYLRGTNFDSRDDLFDRLLRDKLALQCRDFGGSCKECYQYFLAFKEKTYATEPFKTLSAEAKSDATKASYRAIILVNKTENCGVGNQCLAKTLEKLNFTLKRPNEYVNYQNFEAVCKKLLWMVLEPFCLPEFTVEKMLHYSFTDGAIGRGFLPNKR